ncbi:MAG TPA: haloacid dehalogenase-like hydrolase, partial [archaeon]|nr:haloacid dehalogenase-like hydrolase [archaeon]
SDLKKDPNVELFVLTTTYRPAANVIADKLGIPRERVIGTELRVENGLVTGVNGPARGGIHKAEAVEELSKRLGVPINKFTVVGDSITDKDMVERVARERGLAISFNANKDLLAKNPTVVVAGKSLRRVSTLVRAFAERGEEGVERVVKRNALLRRLVIPRPFLKVHMFKGAGAGPAEAERAAKASEKYRRLTRKAKYARLR